jgi:hypothetical protein
LLAWETGKTGRKRKKLSNLAFSFTHYSNDQLLLVPCTPCRQRQPTTTGTQQIGGLCTLSLSLSLSLFSDSIWSLGEEEEKNKMHTGIRYVYKITYMLISAPDLKKQTRAKYIRILRAFVPAISLLKLETISFTF